MKEYQMKKDEVLKMLEVDENGLSSDEAEINQALYGPNKLQE